MSNRYNQYKQGKSHQGSPFGSQHSTSYGVFGSASHPPGLQPPPSYEPSATRLPFSFGRAVVYLIILAQAVSFIFFYDLPSKLDDYSKATDRFRVQRDAMREEARHLERERVALRVESNRLEKERLELELSTLKMEGEKDALESAIHRSELERSRFEREKQLLEHQRQSMEHQKEELREERERWEKAREERVPQGAFWESVEPAPDCRAYGKREYSGKLQNIPDDWTDLDACMNMPVEIKGVTLRRPDRCAYDGGSPRSIHGIWTVDWDQPDCRPSHIDVSDKGCTNPGSGTRRIEAWVVGINDKPEQDWRLLCESTPFTWRHVTYSSPTRCEAGLFGKKYAMWEVPDDSC